MNISVESLRQGLAARRKLLIALLLLAGSPFLAGQIANETDPTKVWALIIGISNYTHAQPLAYAATDAQSFSAFLQSPRGGGILPDHIFTLLEEDASRAGILQEFENMWDRVEAGHTIYVFIAGHGVIHPKRPIGYFIPSDGKITNINATSISFLGLAEQLNAGFFEARQRILLSDMCHAGLGDTANLINNYVMDKFGVESEGTFLNLAASGPNETSFEREDLGHGAFTYSLLEALNGQSTDDPVVSAQELVSYVQRKVPELTAFNQNPVVNEGFDPEYPLADLDKPGPAQIDENATFLRLENPTARELVRAQWTDPATESVVVRRIPPGENTVAIGPLQPGSLELQFFDRDNNAEKVTVDLAEGENVLNVDEVALSTSRPERYLVASLAPPALPLPPLQTSPAFDPDSQAQLVMRLETGTDVYLDGYLYAQIDDTSRPLQIQGLRSGEEVSLRLVFSPTHEGRYRLKLRSGPHLFDVATQELRGLMAIEPPPSFTQPPADLDSSAQQLFRQFKTSLWQEELVQPAGENAFEFLQQLRGLLTAEQLQTAERELVVALGDKAQRILLRYLRGGDVR